MSNPLASYDWQRLLGTKVAVLGAVIFLSGAFLISLTPRASAIVQPTGSISGVKFHDHDGNGVRDEGDSGLAGWKIVLNDSASTTTAEDGSYSFNELANGEYTVCEVLKDGWKQTAPGEGPECPGGTTGYKIIIEEGEAHEGKDFGNQPTGSISGVKFNDLNGNGSREEEPGLEEWQIVLTGANGSSTANTDGAGNYSFKHLLDGDYTVCETLQNSWKQTAPTSSDEGVLDCPGGLKGWGITVRNGEASEGKNFGNQRVNSISGTKFKTRTNGSHLGRLAGWKIVLTDPNGNETSTTTNEDGNYFFNNLADGKYTVCEVAQNGWRQTLPGVRSGNKIGCPGGITGYILNLSNGDNEDGIDFGNSPPNGRIFGMKFNDLNGNGVRDEGDDEDEEPGLGDWKIVLTDNAASTTASTTTNGNGDYSFKELADGDYTVCEVLQDGWKQTAPTSSDDTTDCEGGTRGYHVVIVGDGSKFNKDFGNVVPVVIAGSKWDDLNGDGLKQENEPGLGGWKMTLRKVVDEVPTEIVALSLTGGDGRFSFVVTQPGTYRITEENKEGWQNTSPADSFFDVFVELEVREPNPDPITHDRRGNPITFGNHQVFVNVFGGHFSPSSGNGSSTTSTKVLDDTTLTFGSSSIFLPEDTIITRSDSSTFDLGAFTGASLSSSDVHGIGGGVVFDGVLKWGLTDLGLNFSPAITVHIWVGSSFNGQTLNILRSTSGGGGWTNDGIGPPTTCVVAGGICTFTAIKASFYGATHVGTPGSEGSAGNIASSIGGGGGGGGGGGAPVVTVPTSTPPTGQVLGAKVFLFTRNLQVGMRGDDVTELQKQLRDEGVYKGPITGYFGRLTKAGVKAYQNKNGLKPAGGTVDLVTRAYLNGSRIAGANASATEVIQARITELTRLYQELLKSLTLKP